MIHSGNRCFTPLVIGLSYTEFAISDASAEKQNGGIMVTANVKNIGEISGKEVIQVYLSKVNPAEGVERPYQELKGFEKTADLAPGEKEKVKIWIPWRELAVYDEGRAAWVIESGDYLLKWEIHQETPPWWEWYAWGIQSLQNSARTV